MTQSNGSIPNVWEYYGLPEQDVKEFFGLYKQAYLGNLLRLPAKMEKVMYPQGWLDHVGSTGQLSIEECRRLQSHEAANAAVFFIIADFIAQYYQKQHPTFRMKETPAAVLQFLRPPFNRMTDLNYDMQKRFMTTLSPEERAIFELN